MRTDEQMDMTKLIVAFRNLYGSHLVVFITKQTTLFQSRLNKHGLFGNKYSETPSIQITITS